MDPRFILASDNEDRTMTLRLAIMATDDPTLFSALWRNEQYNIQDLYDVANFLRFIDKKWGHVDQLF